MNINGEEIRTGVAHGLENARNMLQSIQKWDTHHHAIEIMACPGGCIDGWGPTLSFWKYRYGKREWRGFMK